MFKGNASKINFIPTDGMKVLVTGRVTIYEATGQYQIYVEDMQEDGIGALYIEFEKLKKELANLGYFNEERKRKIPKYPSKVGVVTASTGAAIKDIITTIKRRYPICEILLFPSLVQGDGDKEDIVKQITRAPNYNLDVLIVGRGGGSIEDMWPFNERIVADAIYNSNIPVISAVGHEIDFTIADFVADLRAPTPTAAGEMAVPNLVDVLNYNKQLQIRLTESINKKIKLEKLNLEKIKGSFVIKNPMLMYENKKQTLSIYQDKVKQLIKKRMDLENNRLLNDNSQLSNIIKSNITIINNSIINNRNRLSIAFKNIIGNANNKLTYNIDKLKLLNPLNVLDRGYSVVYANNNIIKSIKEIKKDDILDIKVSNGIINTKVIEVKGEIV